jgi:hypothetical protein
MSDERIDVIVRNPDQHPLQWEYWTGTKWTDNLDKAKRYHYHEIPPLAEIQAMHEKAQARVSVPREADYPLE